MKQFILLHKKSLLYIGFSFFLIVLFQLAARKFSGFGEFYATHVFPVFPNTLGRLLSPVPFSIFEVGLYLLALFIVGALAYFIFLLVRNRTKARKLFPSAILFICGFLTTVFLMLTLTCSINYSRNGFIFDAGLSPSPSSRESLVSLSTLLIDDLEKVTGRIPLDGQGRFSVEGLAVKKEAKKAMKLLGETYPSLSGYYPNPKPVLLSSKMSDINLTGIFSPYTIEANYNRDVNGYVIPYTICHELAHLKGYIKEDEAGFIAYLACSNSPSPELKYSAAVSALSYTLNALYKNSSQEEYMEILRRVPAQALYDLQSNQKYWQEHQGTISDISRSANDAYLKANAQADGVKSYGRMVDLLLSYYKLNATSI